MKLVTSGWQPTGRQFAGAVACSCYTLLLLCQVVAGLTPDGWGSPSSIGLGVVILALLLVYAVAALIAAWSRGPRSRPGPLRLLRGLGSTVGVLALAVLAFAVPDAIARL